MEEFELFLGKPFVGLNGARFTPPSPTIDATQRRVNELMGVSDEDFLKYACKASGPDSMELTDEDRAKINQLMGVSDEDMARYSCKSSDPDSDLIDEASALQKVADMMGNSLEDIKKYG